MYVIPSTITQCTYINRYTIYSNTSYSIIRLLCKTTVTNTPINLIPLHIINTMNVQHNYNG